MAEGAHARAELLRLRAELELPAAEADLADALSVPEPVRPVTGLFRRRRDDIAHVKACGRWSDRIDAAQAQVDRLRMQLAPPLQQPLTPLLSAPLVQSSSSESSSASPHSQSDSRRQAAMSATAGEGAAAGQHGQPTPTPAQPAPPSGSTVPAAATASLPSAQLPPSSLSAAAPLQQSGSEVGDPFADAVGRPQLPLSLNVSPQHQRSISEMQALLAGTSAENQQRTAGASTSSQLSFRPPPGAQQVGDSRDMPPPPARFYAGRLQPQFGLPLQPQSATVYMYPRGEHTQPPRQQPPPQQPPAAPSFAMRSSQGGAAATPAPKRRRRTIADENTQEEDASEGQSLHLSLLSLRALLSLSELTPHALCSVLCVCRKRAETERPSSHGSRLRQLSD
jgi:hypothetical protein